MLCYVIPSDTATCNDTSALSLHGALLISVNDTEAPSIACPSNVTVSTDAGKCFATSVNLGAPVTSDNCAVTSVDNNSQVQFLRGSTTVPWTVNDTSGNNANCAQMVTVNVT